MTQKQLKRGDIVRRSIQGAKGFFYPDFEGRAIMVREDCIAHCQVGWNTYQDFVAHYVSSTSFAEKDRYDLNKNKKMVVWVKKNG